jgi:hypothetical protein
MAYTWDKAPGSRLGTSSVVTLTTASQATAAFGAQTYQIRVATGATVAFIKVGDGTPTATTTGDSALLPANTIDYFCVTPGQKAAVIGSAGSNQVSVTEMS